MGKVTSYDRNRVATQRGEIDLLPLSLYKNLSSESDCMTKYPVPEFFLVGVSGKNNMYVQ
jgi:hypothetical protein